MAVQTGDRPIAPIAVFEIGAVGVGHAGAGRRRFPQACGFHTNIVDRAGVAVVARLTV